MDWLEIFKLILSAFLGSLFALAVERLRSPRLTFIIPDRPILISGKNVVKIYCFQILAVNKKIIFPLSLLLNRNAAQSCTISTKYYSGDKLIYNEYGRWANSIDPAFSETDKGLTQRERYPDPWHVSVLNEEPIDIIVKSDNDIKAYIFNNKAYRHPKWSNTDLFFNPGEYRLELCLSTLDGFIFKKDFIIRVGADVCSTCILSIPKKSRFSARNPLRPTPQKQKSS